MDANYRVLFFQEKPKAALAPLINAGVYFIERNLIQQYPEGSASLEKEWFVQWLEGNRVLGLVLNDYFYDIGTQKRFEFAEMMLGQKRC